MAWSPGLTFGISRWPKGIQSTLVEDFDSSAATADVGVMLQTPIRGWYWGASILNMGGELEFKNSGDPLPLQYRLGTSFVSSSIGKGDEENSWFWYGTDQIRSFSVSADIVRDREEEVFGSVGIEFVHRTLVALRAGYKYGLDSEGFALGFGYQKSRYSLDYSIGLVDNFDNMHRFSLTFGW